MVTGQDCVNSLRATNAFLYVQCKSPTLTGFSMVHAPVLLINDERGGDFGDRAAHRPDPRATATSIDADHTSTMDHLEFLRLARSFLAVGVDGALTARVSGTSPGS